MTSHVPASCEVPRRKVTAKLRKIFEETIECAEKHKSAPRQWGGFVGAHGIYYSSVVWK